MGMCLPSTVLMAWGTFQQSLNPCSISIPVLMAGWTISKFTSVLPNEHSTHLRDDVVYGQLPHPEGVLERDVAFSYV